MEINEAFIDSLAVDQKLIINKIVNDLSIPSRNVEPTVNLLKDDNSIPFISRYRKEMTGSLDEVQVRDISHKLSYYENLENRKIEVIKAIFNQGKLTEPLLANIAKAQTLVEVEDLYAPYKRKKKTRGMIAIEKGLEGLADIMEKEKDQAIETVANDYIDEEKGVASVEEALTGAQDILAERIAHDLDHRKIIKDYMMKNGNFMVKGLKDADTSVYKMYYDYSEPLNSIKAHRVLAINRGEREKELEVKIDYDEANCLIYFSNQFEINNDYYKFAIEDGLKRLLLPAVIREIRTDQTDNADGHGIKVFSDNLSNLLLQPPIKKTTVLGIDPGIRTGTKAAAVDQTGKFLGYFTFFQKDEQKSKQIIAENITKYKIELVAIGNGTGSHEVQQLVAECINEYKLPLQYTIVSEDGASVYSASDTAREEFPDLDLTIRGAISIARRLQDPLAELVKIDPKSIGVGLYQHDVNQSRLSDTLDETVESVVNNVGVNINTASFSLLKYVSGITSRIAKHIVKFREDNGIIKNRSSLKDISGIGDKVFEQAAGFLKIPESSDPLDNTWVHPENYDVAREIYQTLQTKKNLTDNDKKQLSDKFDVGLTTIDDIIEELNKPNRDPRDDYPQPIMQKGVINFEDLKAGMKVTGKVKNVVDFGAFVDIGIKETALLHISEMGDQYIKSPHEVMKVGDVKEFKIIEIDTIRKRISLSLRSGQPVQKNTQKPKKKKFDYSSYIIS
ncbi:MAG: RNA-binding transcriptional accessory protein [Spirochaetes bacterium]|nr:RNA-binding transcriptional accessory protein [Spirochaetota bacterium]